MHDFNKKIDTPKAGTTCRRHITREFGLKSWEKIGVGGELVKLAKKLGASYSNILLFTQVVPFFSQKCRQS
jgi:hypothetical protein